MILLQKTTADEIVDSINPVVDKLEGWRDYLLHMTPNIVMAILTLIIFYLIGRFLRHAIVNYIGKHTTNKSATEMIALIVYALTLIAGIMVALSFMQLGKAVTGFLAGAGIVGVALGFAFQETAANFISGTFMAFKSNFRVGDLVETNNTLAVVEKIDLRSTKMKSLDGYQIIFPNKDIFQKKLVNYNAYSSRRMLLSCGVSFDSDLDLVEKITIEALQGVDAIKKSPSPQLYFREFGDHAIIYDLYYWIDFLSMPDYLDAQHLAVKAIKKAYNQNDINIPFPIRTLDFGKNNLTINPSKSN